MIQIYFPVNATSGVLITCEVEWCGVAPLCVSAVDILWGAEFLDSGQAALLGSVQQGGITPQQVLDVCVSIFHHVQWHVTITVLLGWIGSVLNKEFEFLFSIHLVYMRQFPPHGHNHNYN